MVVAGFDEVGRGAWAGPLCIVGVALSGRTLEGLKDSKQLTADKRARLYRHVLREADDISIWWGSNRRIDSYGLADCLKHGFQACAAPLQADSYIVDGSVQYLANTPNAVCQVKADEQYASVAAASIVAKHLRDTYMRHLDTIESCYGFMRHVGYGTAAHRQALQLHGPSLYHRRSFKGVV